MHACSWLGSSQYRSNLAHAHAARVYDARACCAAAAQAWIEAFFARGVSGIARPQRSVRVVRSPEYNVLSRSNSTLHATWTYDAINFKGISQ